MAPGNRHVATGNPDFLTTGYAKEKFQIPLAFSPNGWHAWGNLEFNPETVLAGG